MVSTSRIRCLAAVAAALALTTPTVRANAQPTCVPGTVADYVALANGCQLDGITFTDFTGDFFGLARPFTGVTVTPLNAGGQVGFALALSPALAVATNVGPTFDQVAQQFEFDFMVRGVGTGALVGVSPFSLFTASVAAAMPGPSGVVPFATATLYATSLAAGTQVSTETGQVAGQPQTSTCTLVDPIAHHVPCTPLVTTDLADGLVAVGGTVFARGSDAPASASLQNLSVVIIPAPAVPVVTAEPTATVLLASGLAALGAVRMRRRRAAPIARR